MKLKNVAILVAVLVVLDQALKIWIKTHLCIDESIEIFSWFQLRFVENNGAAFGMHIANNGGFDWGKLLLSSFRMVMIGLLGYYICHLARKREGTPRGVFVGLAMIFAGALGNLIDSLFYGLIFTFFHFSLANYDSILLVMILYPTHLLSPNYTFVSTKSKVI